MKERVLVTGGMGYLGSRLVAYLESLGRYEVLLTTRREFSHKPEWIQNAQIVTADLSSSAALKETCKNITAVIHLGAANEIDSAKDPVGVVSDTARQAYALLHAVPKGTRFIYLSTAHVYGSPLEGVIDENTVPQPRHPYAIARRTAEDLIFSAHAKQDVDAVVFRLSNGIGAPNHAEHTRWTLIGNDLCQQAVREKKLTLKSSGTQLRDFIPMKDVLRAIVWALELPKGQAGEPLYNLGGDRTMSILEMARFIAKRCEQVCGYFPEITRVENKNESPMIPLQYETRKLKTAGFELETSLEEEIDATLRFCQQAVEAAGELR